jgi:hypothetical protein
LAYPGWEIEIQEYRTCLGIRESYSVSYNTYIIAEDVSSFDRCRRIVKEKSSKWDKKFLINKNEDWELIEHSFIYPASGYCFLEWYYKKSKHPEKYTLLYWNAPIKDNTPFYVQDEFGNQKNFKTFEQAKKYIIEKNEK